MKKRRHIRAPPSHTVHPMPRRRWHRGRSSCSLFDGRDGSCAGSRVSTARIAASDLRRQPLQAFVLRAVFTVADISVRAPLLIPAIARASRYTSGEFQELGVRNENVAAWQRNMHPMKTPAVEPQREVANGKSNRERQERQERRRFCRSLLLDAVLRRISLQFV